MLRIIIQIIMAILLTMGFGSLADSKPYRTLSINNPNYVADVPDNVILPDTRKFELAGPPRKHPNNPNLLMVLYRDTSYQYFDESSGEEVFPYMELIKREEADFHLVTLAFINEEIKLEVYEDHGAFRGPACDRLEKFESKEGRQIRRVSR